jgi:hypothetical protein
LQLPGYLLLQAMIRYDQQSRGCKEKIAACPWSIILTEFQTPVIQGDCCIFRMAHWKIIIKKQFFKQKTANNKILLTLIIKPK